MLDKKKEYIAEALDEIRDEYIEEAVNFQKKSKKKIYATLAPIAACLVLVISFTSYYGFFGGSNDTTGASESANQMMDATELGEAALDESTMEGTVTEGDPESDRGIDGAESSEVGDNESVGNLSGNVEPGNDASGNGASGTTESYGGEGELLYKTAEEIVSEDMLIFRGVVEDIIYGSDEDRNPLSASETLLVVKVSDVIKGDLKQGTTCEILIPANLAFAESVGGDLAELEIGSEAIFMPRDVDSYYYDYYFSEGRRYLFLETEEGVSYATEVYQISGGNNVTLDDVAEYLRGLLE